mgnify:CR=1 FL=1
MKKSALTAPTGRAPASGTPRDPHHKTVYVVASYPVAAVELLVNGRRVGRCDKPQNTFVFAFPGVDVTQSGWVEAVGYGYDGTPSASDRLETAGSPPPCS